MFNSSLLPSDFERQDGYPVRDDSLGYYAQQRSSSFGESDLTLEQEPLYRRHGYSTEEEFRAAEKRARQRVHKIAPWIAGLDSAESVDSQRLETDFIYPGRPAEPSGDVKPAHEYLSKRKVTASSCLAMAKDVGRSAQKVMETFRESALNVRIEPSSAKPRLPALAPLLRTKSKLGKRALVIGSPVLEEHVAWHRPGNKTAGHHMITIEEAQIRESARRQAFALKQEQEQEQRNAQPALQAGGARKPSVNRAPRIQSTWGALIDAAHNFPEEDDSANSIGPDVSDALQEHKRTPRPQTMWPDGFGKLTLDFSKGAHEPTPTQASHESEPNLDSSFATTDDSWFETEASSSAPTTPPAMHPYVFPDTPVLPPLEGRFKHMSVDEDDHELVVDQHVRQGHVSTYGKHAMGGEYVDAWRSRTQIGEVKEGDPAAVLMQQLDVARQTGGSIWSSRRGDFF